jgi:ATP-binding cassette, subfamily B, bacterial
MKELLTDCLWTREQLSGALDSLARAAGLRSATVRFDKSTTGWDNDLNFQDWLDINLSRWGLEAEPIQISYGEVETSLQKAAPAILEYTGSQHHGFLVLMRRRWQKIILLKPDQSTCSVAQRELTSMLCYEQRESVRPEIDTLLEFAGINSAERASVLDAFLNERLKNKWIGKYWRVRPNPGSDFWEQVRNVGTIPLFSGFFISHAAAYVVLLIFWSLLGNAVFSGAIRAQTFWLLTGLLLLLAPLYQIPPWLYGILSIRIGERLKQRLLYGALRLEADEIRHQGLGQFLGRVIETEAIETSAMRGSVSIFMGLIQLIVIVPYLAAGVGGWFQAAVLCAWLGFSLVVSWRYLQARALWTRTRLNLTNEMVEQLLGYRTRLAQQSHAEWHLQEEQLLAEYDRSAVVMDRRHAWLKVALPHGWTLAGSLVLLPFLMSFSIGIAEIALAVSGVVFASISFHQFVAGLIQFSDAWVAWDQVKLLFDAAARPLRSSEENTSGTTLPKKSEALLDATNLRFQYTTRSEVILNDCNFSIQAGDRILLLGSSGSGKSTLAAVLCGLRTAQQGTLTLGGRTEKEMGERAWRKRIVAAPQFHENHIFTETFAFNLLMGRRWPPTREDLQKAKEICIALGLGDLLEEMPGGMFQFVGETGWQLSHGEKSRVYIARALLQGADLIILDESFSALDTGSLRQSLECVIEHAPTLVVVAHP